MGVAGRVAHGDGGSVDGDGAQVAVERCDAGCLAGREVPDRGQAVVVSDDDSAVPGEACDGSDNLAVGLGDGDVAGADVPDVGPPRRVRGDGVAALVVDRDVEEETDQILAKADRQKASDAPH